MPMSFAARALPAVLAALAMPAAAQAAVITTTDPEVGGVVHAEPEFRKGQPYGPYETVNSDGNVQYWTCPRGETPRYDPERSGVDRGRCTQVTPAQDEAGDPNGVYVLDPFTAGLVLYATEVAPVDREPPEGRPETFYVYRLSEPVDIRSRPANPKVTLSHRTISLRDFIGGRLRLKIECASACLAESLQVSLSRTWARRLVPRSVTGEVSSLIDQRLRYDDGRWYPGGGSVSLKLPPSVTAAQLRRARRFGAKRLNVVATAEIVQMNMPRGSPSPSFRLPLTIRL